ncbi:hypothetical protein BO94DRAFT_101377 [Aspergillus sclerotioniger CBS 115572]|uniref:Uncharacterized protein n=1 Tax=Aspergillus sclerotioniger CBS 115572 TaxID=1450535 RepID=A0A317WER9_9EURO|nr:hypothetical protein BO94DRAFT_101377 [Aspergillus sclerotioniger CBS 115572]PWY84515.1 hypothetical protein BO94DRAFT_101377 [Aspergillus sclerotioniger CBS 115572]
MSYGLLYVNQCLQNPYLGHGVWKRNSTRWIVAPFDLNWTGVCPWLIRGSRTHNQASTTRLSSGSALTVGLSDSKQPCGANHGHYISGPSPWKLSPKRPEASKSNKSSSAGESLVNHAYLCRTLHPRMISEQFIASSLRFNQIETATTLDPSRAGWRLKHHLSVCLDWTVSARSPKVIDTLRSRLHSAPTLANTSAQVRPCLDNLGS